jgi:hypothetical protein
MIENPATISQPGSPFSAAIPSSSTPKPAIPALLSGGHHAGTANPAMIRYNNSGFFSRVAEVASNPYTRYRVQGEPILPDSSTAG